MTAPTPPRSQLAAPNRRFRTQTATGTALTPVQVALGGPQLPIPDASRDPDSTHPRPGRTWRPPTADSGRKPRPRQGDAPDKRPQQATAPTSDGRVRGGK
ncbi:hypothetical protein GCM10017576_09890 [Microbacterium barkeri]|uniref:Uncharacterized protein n=1 Tax=Microbacterium barkeri TaxID=33917 RepID=A0A9W6H264_9MICO|nr:hypothetical protein GCM10017576_09890 [Microbacterium barkeri]